MLRILNTLLVILFVVFAVSGVFCEIFIDDLQYKSCNDSMFSIKYTKTFRTDVIDYYRNSIVSKAEKACYIFDRRFERNLLRDNNLDSISWNFYLKFIKNMPTTIPCKICLNDCLLEVPRKYDVYPYTHLMFQIKCMTMAKHNILLSEIKLNDTDQILRKISLVYSTSSASYVGNVIFNEKYLIFRFCENYTDSETNDEFQFDGELVFLKERIPMYVSFLCSLFCILFLLTILYLGNRYSNVT